MSQAVNSPLYQVIGGTKKKINLETVFDQVKENDGGKTLTSVISELKGQISNVIVPGGLVLKATVTQNSELPTQDYKKGWYYVVTQAGEYKGETCEVGDSILVVNDYVDSDKNEDFVVIQGNLSNSVSNDDVSVIANTLVQFADTTGKKLTKTDITVTDVTSSVVYSKKKWSMTVQSDSEIDGKIGELHEGAFVIVDPSVGA